MKSKGPSKGLLKIIAMTSVAIFGLFGAFAGSIAWFNTIQHATNNGDNFAVQNADAISVSHAIYRYDQERKVGIEDTNSSLSLNAYDTFITSRNAYNSIYLKLNVTFEHSSGEGKYIRLGATCTSGYLDANNHVVAASSNIIYFSTLLVSCTNTGGVETKYVPSVDFTSDNSTYTTARSAFTDASAKYAFVSGSPLAKANQTIPLYSSSGFSIPAGMASAVFLVKYDYSDALVENFIEKCGRQEWGSGVLSGDIISFTADITTLEVNYV